MHAIDLAFDHVYRWTKNLFAGWTKLVAFAGTSMRQGAKPALERVAGLVSRWAKAGIAHGRAAAVAYAALLRKDPLDAVDLALAHISRTIKIVAALGLFSLSLFILADVVSRGLLSVPLIGLKEMIANSIAIIAFLQLPYTVRIGGMLRVEILDTKLPPHVHEVLKRLIWVLGGLLFAIVAYAGFDPMIRSWVSGEYEGEGGFRVPSYPVRATIVFGSALGAANFFMLALRGERGIRE